MEVLDNQDFATYDESVYILDRAQATYGDVYRIVVCDIEFYLRSISRIEFSVLLERCEDGFHLEESIASLCTILPQNYDFTSCKAGIPGIVAVTVLNISGFGNMQRTLGLLEHFREIVNTTDRHMDAIIMSTFPQYTMHDLQKLTRAQHLELFAMAEWVCNNIRQTPIVTTSQEDLKKAQFGQLQQHIMQERASR